MKRKNDASRIVKVLVIVFILSSSFYMLINIPVISGTYDFKTFSSYEEMVQFFKERFNGSLYPAVYYDTPLRANGGIKLAFAEGETVDFSRTNIQIEGVDEPDIVKTDGIYIYLISGEKLYIIKAYPPEDSKTISTITFDCTPEELFIQDSRLVIFSTVYSKDWYSSCATMYLYDISERSNPILIKTVGINGSYVDARMIGSHVYMISSESVYMIYRNGELKIPTLSIDDERIEIAPTSIYYIDIPEPVESMVHVLSLNINNGETKQKSFMLGYSQTIFVSRENIYISCDQPYILNLQSLKVSENHEFTTVYKIGIDDGDIEFVAQGKVPGHILNQFSMDEHNGFLRVATTIGNVWDGSSKNNVYILDENLNQVGAIENIAPGERIYSARFMGDRAYLVTFKKVDPFFTLDLSDPYNPKLLGKLKIPGYSDYLHPYDENHIIGIGKETVEALPQEKDSRGIDFAWYQGLKIALFDVSDFEHPKEVAKVVIGDRGTSSPVLWDHKAFLFSRDKNLLVIPVTVYEIDEEIKELHDGYTGNIYGKFTFQGAYVYHVSPQDGFVLKGRITHGEESSGYSYWYSPSAIKRSLYIEDVLYTISDRMIKMNNLEDMEEMNCIELS